LIVVRVLDVHRLAALLGTEVTPAGTEVRVVKVKDQGGPWIVQIMMQYSRGDVLVMT
jgi:hypothetical protein